MKSCSLSGGVCLTKCFHQTPLIEAICRGCAADVNLCLGWQVYTHTSPLACLSIENSNVTSQKKKYFSSDLTTKKVDLEICTFSPRLYVGLWWRW